MHRLVHFLSGLEVGGKERVALRLAARGRQEGLDHRLLLFDSPYRDSDLDFDPGDVPTDFLPRGPGMDWRFARRVARFLGAHDIEILHAHNDSALVYGALAARLVKRRRPAVVATFHTRPSHVTWLARLLSRWASKRVGRVVAVSEDLGEFLVSTRWIHGYTTVWNGVDADAFHPEGERGHWRRELDVPEGALLVGHVGRFDPVKRHVDLIKAARALKDHDPPLVFVLVGQGPVLEDMQAEARDCGHVRFVPRVEDVVSLLRDLDVFVLCSEHEAAPCVVLEAMACGRAVIATAVGGVPHILNPGDTPSGRLLPPCRPDLLAGAISELARDPERRRHLGAMARQRVEVFSAHREWEHCEEIYREALEEPP